MVFKMRITKLLNNNVQNNLIGVNITEYDLRKAHPTALALLYPDNPDMRNLINLPKEQYTIKIGNMIKANSNLRKEIDRKVLELFNEFLEANNIAPEHLLATTPDSLLIVDQIAQQTVFQNIAVFRCKEGISYSSLFYYKSYQYILYDRLTKRMRIKGVGSEEETKKYQFVKNILRRLCTLLDNSTTIEHMELLKGLKDIRIDYLNSRDMNVYRCLDHKNQFKYIIDGQETFSDVQMTEDDNCILVKSDNYMNFILPLIQSFV